MRLADDKEYFKNSRERTGLTQSQVAKALGYGTPQFVSNWERGLSYPPVKAIPVLSKLYKVSQDSIFERVLRAGIEQTERSLRSEYKRLYRGVK